MSEEEIRTIQEPSAPPEEPVAETSTPSELRSVAKDLGYTDEDLSQFSDDRQLATSLFQIANEYGQFREQAEPLVQLGQKVAPYADKLSDFEKWIQDQQKAPESPQDEGPKFDWQAPEYDPTWEQASIEADPIGYAQAQAKLKQYKQFREETLRKFTQDPRTIVNPIVEQLLAGKEKSYREYADQAVEKARWQWQQEQQQTVVQSEEQAWLRENVAEFYVHDDKGQMVVGNDGNPVATDVGRKAWRVYQWARGLWGQDGNPLPVRQAAQIAMSQIPRPSPNGQPPEQEPPKRFLDTVSDAERHPERRQSVADDSAPASMYPDEEDQFDAAIRAAAKLEGVSLSR